MEVEQDSESRIVGTISDQKEVTPSENEDGAISEDMNCTDSPEQSSLQGALPSEAEMIASLLRHSCWVCGATAPSHEDNIHHMMSHLNEVYDTSPERAAWTPGGTGGGVVKRGGGVAWGTPGTPWGGPLGRASTPRPAQDAEATTIDAPQPAERPAAMPGLVCAICLRVFTERSLLIQHVEEEVRSLRSAGKKKKKKTTTTKKSKEPSSASPPSADGFACDLCGKAFPIKMALRVHEARAHPGKPSGSDKSMSDRPHLCPCCPKRFRRRSHLEKHRRVHEARSATPASRPAQPLRSRAATPKTNTPKTAPLKTAAPKISSPKISSPKISPPKIAAPKTPRTATPKSAQPQAATPKTAAKQPSAARPKTPRTKVMFPCSSCEKSYTAERHLRRHILQVHSPSMPHVCLKCGRNCHSRKRLHSHMEGHINDRVREVQGANGQPVEDGDAAPSDSEDPVQTDEAGAKKGEGPVHTDEADAKEDVVKEECEEKESVLKEECEEPVVGTAAKKIIFKIVANKCHQSEAASVAAKLIPQITEDLAAKAAQDAADCSTPSADPAKTKVVYMLLSKRGVKDAEAGAPEGDDVVKVPANVATKPLTKMYLKVMKKKPKLKVSPGKEIVKTLVPKTPPKVGFKVVKRVVPCMVTKPKVLPGIVPLGGYLKTVMKKPPADFSLPPAKAPLRLTSVLTSPVGKNVDFEAAIPVQVVSKPAKPRSPDSPDSSTQPGVPKEGRLTAPPPSRSLLMPGRTTDSSPARSSPRIKPSSVGSSARAPTAGDPDRAVSDNQAQAPASPSKSTLTTLRSFRMHPQVFPSGAVSSTANCICDKCGQHFKGDALFKLHLIRAHGITVVKKFQCQCCGAAYRDKEMLRAHLRTH